MCCDADLFTEDDLARTRVRSQSGSHIHCVTQCGEFDQIALRADSTRKRNSRVNTHANGNLPIAGLWAAGGGQYVLRGLDSPGGIFCADKTRKIKSGHRVA